MRYRIWFPLLAGLAACSFAPADSSRVTLHNSEWDKVNIQVVITKSANCDNRGPEFVGEQDFYLLKDQNRTVIAPSGTSVCWRHDRFPANPKPGEWSGWSRAIPFPGEDTTTEI